MASEFYEQLGVDRAASAARIRSSYGQAVSRLAKRRRALIEQGGDTRQLDLQRARLDEAWEVLSDPLRRRRYDAMLKWADGRRPKEAEAVWAEVSDALVHPAAAVAAKLLRVTSKLPEIGALPLAPSGAAEEPPTLVPHDDDLTTPKAARLGGGARLGAGGTEPPTETTTPRLAVPRPGLRKPATSPAPAPERIEPPALVGRLPEPDPGLRVVDGAPGTSDVLVMPRRPEKPALQALPADAVADLVDDLGYGGGLLRAVRERLGLSVQDVADHTRISVRYLEALEGETKASLPSATFVRGYVREIARMLQLDAEAVAAGYMRRFEG